MSLRLGWPRGKPGAVGANWVERAGKTEHEIFSARHQMQMNAGDFFVVQTPGGGYGDER